jgi:hypothetical protein
MEFRCESVVIHQVNDQSIPRGDLVDAVGSMWVKNRGAGDDVDLGGLECGGRHWVVTVYHVEWL